MTDNDVASARYLVELVGPEGLPLDAPLWKQFLTPAWGGAAPLTAAAVQVIHRRSGLVVWRRSFWRRARAKTAFAGVTEDLTRLSAAAFAARYDEDSTGGDSN
jgi:hypothetical protein